MLLFLSGVFPKFGGLADFWLLLQLTHEVPRYQINENHMTLSTTCKASETDLILSGSSISSWTSSSLDTSITSLAGFSCFSVISFRISCRQEMLPASTAVNPGSNILVKTDLIICVNVTSIFLYQISKFFIFILV